MPEEMNWKKFLEEEVLHEIWHESKIAEYGHCNRTYDNFGDVLSLYEVIFNNNKWEEFGNYLYSRWDDLFLSQRTTREYVRWLLYFANNKDYEDRCRLAAEFYGWEKEK
jgi:hypothetical protein